MSTSVCSQLKFQSEREILVKNFALARTRIFGVRKRGRAMGGFISRFTHPWETG